MTSHLAQANSSAYDSPSYLQSPPPHSITTIPLCHGAPKKAPQTNQSVRFSGSSSPNQLIEPSRKKRNAGPVIDDGDSDVEQLPTPSVDVDATTSGSVSKLSKVILTDAQEL
ncbi:hypothetical protein KEM48_010260, partial [Puccinia striiformis f. sp. tritici PST-130]